MSLDCITFQRSRLLSIHSCCACGRQRLRPAVRGWSCIAYASGLDSTRSKGADNSTAEPCSCSRQQDLQQAVPQALRALDRKRNSNGGDPNGVGSSGNGWSYLVAAAGLPSLSAPPSPAPRFRYWIDEPALWMNSSGPGHLLDKALSLLGGLRTGSDARFSRSAAPDPAALGCQHTDKWDLLWSSRKVCMLAAPKLRPGQAISNVPGLYMLTLKPEVVLTLRAVFGDDLGGIMPPTFVVPEELEQWQKYLADNAEDVVLPGEEANQLWMLKSLSGLGRGLMLVSGADGPQRLRELNKDNKRPFVVAQKYIGDPLLITGRKFHIRAWMLVTGVNPLRGYLYRKGLLLFSSSRYDPAATHTAGGAVAASHVTNRHQNADSRVWSLEQLKRHVGPERWKQIWYQLQELSAAALAAGLKQLLKAKRLLQTPPNSDFHLLGLDFVLDADYKAWLLEINSNPSLSASHQDPEFREVLHSTKWSMLLELLHLVLLRFDTSSPVQHEARDRMSEEPPGSPRSIPNMHRPQSQQHQGLALARMEMQNLSNFVPLMPFFPLPPSPYSYHIPWQPSDVQLGEMCRQFLRMG